MKDLHRKDLKFLSQADDREMYDHWFRVDGIDELDGFLRTSLVGEEVPLRRRIIFSVYPKRESIHLIVAMIRNQCAIDVLAFVLEV